MPARPSHSCHETSNTGILQPCLRVRMATRMRTHMRTHMPTRMSTGRAGVHTRVGPCMQVHACVCACRAPSRRCMRRIQNTSGCACVRTCLCGDNPWPSGRLCMCVHMRACAYTCVHVMQVCTCACMCMHVVWHVLRTVQPSPNSLAWRGPPPTSLKVNMHACTYAPAGVHTRRRAGAQVRQRAGVQAHRRAGAQACRGAGVQAHKCAGAQTCRRAGVQAHKCAGAQACRRAGVQACKCTGVQRHRSHSVHPARQSQASLRPSPQPVHACMHAKACAHACACPQVCMLNREWINGRARDIEF